MAPRPLRWILPALLLLAGWSESRAQEHGVLLGLRYEEPIPKPLPYYAGDADSLSRAAYRTLLITKSDETFVVWPEENDLLIPHGNTFWRAGSKRSIYNNWVEDFVWAAPDDASPSLVGIQPYNGEFCEGHRKQSVLYASPQFLSLDQQSAGYCEGAAHPWFFNTLAVVPLDSTTHTGLSIADVLGEAAYEALENGVKSFLDGLENERRAAYIEEPDAANWGLARREGRWSTLGRLEAAETATRSASADVPLALDLPPAFTGPHPSSLLWTHIQTFAPDAVDAFVAPEADWLILLRPDHLAIHPVADGAIGQVALTVPVAPGTRAVMVQWAVDAPLRRWVEHVDRHNRQSN